MDIVNYLVLAGRKSELTQMKRHPAVVGDVAVPGSLTHGKRHP